MSAISQQLRTHPSGDQPPDLEQLVRSHYRIVYNLAYRTLGRREDAEDITQQTFARALPRLRELREQAAAGRWLCRIAANLCFDELRRRQRQGAAADTDDEALHTVVDPDALGRPSAAVELRETRLSVWRAALALPPQQRLALALREWHQMSYAEIARVMGNVSVGAVESLLFRARQGFRLAYSGLPLADPRVPECNWVTEHLSSSLDQELDDREQRRIDAHLLGCDVCLFAARELRAVSRLYALMPLLPPAADTVARVVAASGAAGLGGTLAIAGSGGLSAALGTTTLKSGLVVAAMMAIVSLSPSGTIDAPLALLDPVVRASEPEDAPLMILPVVGTATAPPVHPATPADPTPTARPTTQPSVEVGREPHDSTLSAVETVSVAVVPPSDTARPEDIQRDEPGLVEVSATTHQTMARPAAAPQARRSVTAEPPAAPAKAQDEDAPEPAAMVAATNSASSSPRALGHSARLDEHLAPNPHAHAEHPPHNAQARQTEHSQPNPHAQHAQHWQPNPQAQHAQHPPSNPHAQHAQHSPSNPHGRPDHPAAPAQPPQASKPSPPPHAAPAAVAKPHAPPAAALPASSHAKPERPSSPPHNPDNGAKPHRP